MKLDQPVATSEVGDNAAMKLLALLALTSVALAAVDDVAGAAVDQHQTVNEKVSPQVHGPVSC